MTVAEGHSEAVSATRPLRIATRPLRIATRTSPLARWQAAHVAAMLAHMGLSTELVAITTTGDARSEVAISALGGVGAFAAEVSVAVLDGRADLAVHSAKDLPSASTPGVVIAAVPPRGDPRDALVGAALAELAPGAVVATGSPRRRAQLAWVRPDLGFVELRGNIETRLDRLPPGGAVVVSAAALDRLGLMHRAAEVLEPAAMLPQVGQGALAVECRAEDDDLIQVLAGIDDVGSHRALTAERCFLSEIGPGCTLPVGAHAGPLPPSVTPSSSGVVILRLEALLASFDGRVLLRRSASGDDPEELGARLARDLLSTAEGALLMREYGR